MNRDNKKIMGQGIFLVVLLVVGYVGYQFIGGAAPEENMAQKKSNEILVLLNDLQAIDIRSSLLDNPGFQALEGHSVKPTPEPKGRTNPFQTSGAAGGE